MQHSPRKHRPAFRPVNTISSPQKPAFDSPLITAEADQKVTADTAKALRDRVYFSPNQNIPSSPNTHSPESELIGNSTSLFDEAWTTNSRLTPSPSPLFSEKATLKDTTDNRDKHRRNKMVKERDPPAASRPTEPPTTKALQDLTNKSPVFGKASPLRNPLKSNAQKDPHANLFNPNKARPELHRPSNPPIRQPSFSSVGVSANSNAPQRSSSQQQPLPSYGGNHPFKSNAQATQPASRYSNSSTGSDLFEIPASQFAPRGPHRVANPTPIALPTNEPLRTVPPNPRPLYSTMGESNGFQPVNNDFKPISFWKNPRQTVILDDLPRKREDDDDDDAFDPDAAIREEGAKFGAPDPYQYVDQSKANENIKALLEGAFDDDEKLPRTRLRKKKKQRDEEDAANSLAQKLKALEVKDEVEEPEEEEEEDDGTVEGMKVKLLPHQVDGVSWMIEKEIGAVNKKGKLTKGGILADDMGLGKTIQSIALILTNPRPDEDHVPENPRNKILPAVGKGTLIVAPLALIKQWEAEISSKVTRSHSLKVLVHHGPSRTKLPDKLKGYDVVITTYQCLQSEHANSGEGPDGIKKGCFGVYWYRVILDEAHTIKNRNAKCTKACYDLRSQYRWCLTGTPMQNNLDELQSLIKFLRIKPYDSLPEWKDSITGPMKNGRGNLAMRRLQVFLKAFMKRRTKDVLRKEGALNFGGKGKDGEEKGGFKLVARNVETIIGEFTAAEREFYDRLSTRAEERLAELMGGEKHSYIGALVLLLRLRQACNHPNLTKSNVKEDKDALTTGAKTETQPGMQTPRRGGAAAEDMDDLANILGGLTVETKRCDVCQVAMTKDNAANGAIRCDDCENDLTFSQKKAKKSKKHKKDKKHRKHKHKRESVKSSNEVVDDETEDEGEVIKPKASQSSRQRRVIIDSDDEEEGEWIVSDGEQEVPDLGKAGGTDDENAEGRGDSLGDVDSDSSVIEQDSEIAKEIDSFIVHDTDEEDEGPIAPQKHRQKKVIDLGSDDEDEGPIVPQKHRQKKAIDLASDDEDGSTADSEGEDSDTESDSDAEDSETESDSDIEYNASSLTPSTKIRQLLQILEKETPDHKVIVFSQFTSMLDLIEPFLRRQDYKFTRYDGSMRNDHREASLEKLRNDKSTRILLCSLKCGSLGLNLTAASRVVIMEPFWNPFVEEQAIDRVHRLNQTVDVTVYRLSIHNSVEERILELQEAKRKLAQAAIEGGKAIGKLSMKDILNLFKHNAELDPRHDDLDDQTLFTRTRVLDSPGRGGSDSTTGVVGRGLSDVLGGAARPKKTGKLRGRIDDGVYGRR